MISSISKYISLIFQRYVYMGRCTDIMSMYVYIVSFFLKKRVIVFTDEVSRV